MDKNLFYRSLEIDQRAVTESDRSVDLSFSSETPVKRWFGTEILLHGPGNVDLSRLKNLGAALMNHNPAVIVGPLKNVRLEDKKGKAKVIFDEDEDGQKAFGKVQSGSLKGVSVGYTVQKYREVLQNEDYTLPDGKAITGPAMIATRWTPHEVSLTSVPLDPTVGVGRALTRSLDGIKIERSNYLRKEIKAMNRNRPLIEDEKTREILGALLKSAELLFGLETKMEMVNRSFDETGLNILEAAKLLNDKLLESEGTARDHRSGADGLNFRLQDVSTEDFCRSLTNPLMLTPEPLKKVKQKAAATRAKVKSFDQVDDESFIDSICKPSVSF